jgi:hypothetical protein
VADFIVLLQRRMEQAEKHGTGPRREQVASAGVTNKTLLLKRVMSSAPGFLDLEVHICYRFNFTSLSTKIIVGTA